MSMGGLNQPDVSPCKKDAEILSCLDGDVLAEPGAADDAADLHLPPLAHRLDVTLVVLLRGIRVDSTLN